VEERRARPFPLAGRPLKRRLKNLEPFVDFGAQSLKCALFLRIERARISFQRGLRLRLNGKNVLTRSLYSAGAGRQQEIPHVGSGKIYLGADLFQRAEAAEKRL